MKSFFAVAKTCPRLATAFVWVSLLGFAQGPPAQSVAPSSAMGPATTVVSSNAAPSPEANAGPSSNSSTSAVAPGSIAPASTPNPEAVSEIDASDNAIDPASLLPALPAVASRKISLVGGKIEKLDRLRDQFTLQIFGGGKMKIYFDPRTRIYNNGAEASVSDLRPGDRVSIDTVLDGSTIFARNIRLKSASAGEGQGVVVSYRGDKGELLLRDALSPTPLKLRVSSQTRLLDHDHAGSANDLVPGTLVAVKFGPQQNGFNPVNEVSILATPGAGFTFVGRVTALDLSTGLLVLTSATDGKTYEIYLDPSAMTLADNLHPSADVTSMGSATWRRI